MSIVPDKRRIKEDETFPLKLRVTYKGIRKYYATGYDANLQEGEAIQKDNVRDKIKQKSFALREIRLNAEKYCIDMDSFSFTKFEKAFFSKSVAVTNVKTVFENCINRLNENGEVGIAIPHSCACKSLHKFRPNLKFEHLTVDFLNKYEHWFLSQGELRYYCRDLSKGFACNSKYCDRR